MSRTGDRRCTDSHVEVHDCFLNATLVGALPNAEEAVVAKTRSLQALMYDAIGACMHAALLCRHSGAQRPAKLTYCNLHKSCGQASKEPHFFV